jgi:hypothetical protein
LRLTGSHLPSIFEPPLRASVPPHSDQVVAAISVAASGFFNTPSELRAIEPKKEASMSAETNAAIEEYADYRDGDTLMEGYFAFASASGKRPCVLVAHDWSGRPGSADRRPGGSACSDVLCQAPRARLERSPRSPA